MKVKWGVIGCGGIADRRTLPGMMLADNAELIAVMDTDMQAAERCKEKYNSKYAFNTVDELLALDDIQAVYIATPVFCHKEQVTKAAAAKKHILLEKPLGLTVAESQEIADICEKAGVMLGVGLMMRFHSCHKKMKEIVAAGEIGQLVSARAQLTCMYPPMENVWRQKKALSGGGALMDMGIHCVDLLRYISGMEPTDICAISGNCVFDYEVEDSGCILMKMANGAAFIVEANFNIPDDAAICRLELYGSEGSIIAEGTISQEDTGTMKVRRCGVTEYSAAQNRTDAQAEVIEGLGGNMYTEEITSFGEAVLSGKHYALDAHEAILSQKVIEDAYQYVANQKQI